MSRHRDPTVEAAPGGLLTLLTLLSMLAMLATNLYLPSLPRLAQEFETTPSAARATLTAFLAAFAAAQLVWGPLSDRWGRRRVLLAGLVLYTVASAACFAAHDLGWLLAARAAQGAGAAAASTLVRAIARDWYQGAELSRTLAIVLTLMTAAPGFSPLLGGFVETTLGWRADFILLALIGAAATLLTWRALPEHHKARVALSPRRLAADYLEMATRPAFLGPTLATSFAVGGLFAFFASAPAIFIQHLGMSPALFGVVPAGLVFALFAGGAMAGSLRQRFGSDGALFIALGLMVLGSACMLLLVLTRALAWPSVVLPLLLYLAGIGIINPVGTAAALEPFAHKAGAAAALNGFFQMAGATLGTALLALFPLPAGLPITLVMGVLAASCTFLLCRRTLSPVLL